MIVLWEGYLPSTVGAVGEVEGCAEVARPERVAAAPVIRPAALHLACSVHREAARSGEPPFVTRALEQRQEGVSIPAVPWQRFAPFRSGPARRGLEIDPRDRLAPRVHR
jgi:hypothetical protein